MMQLGLALPQWGWGHPTCVPTFARAAEEMGYHSLWVGDRLLTPTHPSDLYPAEPKPYPPEFTSAADPFAIIAAAAAVTSTIRLGSSSLTAPWYGAAVLARSLTTIDAMSGGRLDVGFGTSWLRDEYTAAGVDWSSRGARLDEVLDLLQRWWNDNPVAYWGEQFQVPESVVDLRPGRPGGPPIHLAGMTDVAMARIGRRADGWILLADMPGEMRTRLWDTARRAAEGVGRDPEALTRVARMNPHDAVADVDALSEQIHGLAADGYDTAFVDLTYCTKNLEDALEAAGDLAARHGLGGGVGETR